MIRAGELRMRLRFGYQEKLDTSYRTLMACYRLVRLHNLRVSLKDQPMSGKILVDYDLYSNRANRRISFRIRIYCINIAE